MINRGVAFTSFFYLQQYQITGLWICVSSPSVYLILGKIEWCRMSLNWNRWISLQSMPPSLARVRSMQNFPCKWKAAARGRRICIHHSNWFLAATELGSVWFWSLRATLGLVQLPTLLREEINSSIPAKSWFNRKLAFGFICKAWWHHRVRAMILWNCSWFICWSAWWESSLLLALELITGNSSLVSL